ncbi:MAG: hypothetical protein NC183_07005, partial [Corallococcus sp.]|nr:hypothetical protein [Corallococcus sp.]
MNKNAKKLFVFVLAIVCIASLTLVLTSCQKQYDMTGVTFDNKTVDYNGQAQTISVSGTLPQGVTVSYAYYTDEARTAKTDSVIEAGKYYVTASFVGEEGYQQPVDMYAVLTVNKIDASSVSLADKTVDYNGQAQTSAISGTLPQGVTVSYAYYSDSACQNKVDSVVDAGTYYVKATFDCGVNYNQMEELKAKLVVEKIPFANVDVTLKGEYLENDVTPKTVAARSEDEETLYVEYLNAAYTIRTDTYVADGDSSVKPSVKYFRTKNADGTLSDPELTNNTITQVGDVLYVQATFADKNHTDTVIVKKITVQKKTYELSTFEDLAIMRAHIFGGTVNGETVEALERGFRKDVRYVLKNDIDCKGQVWTPVQVAVKTGGSASVVSDNAFCSEFDGKGYEISNYKITSESFDMDEIKNNQFDRHTRLHIGFFGYANECEIHDVTFSNVQITLDKTFADRDFAPAAAGGDVIYYVGVLVGRLDSATAQAMTDGADLYNITVKNS